ncbi:hypothetical protein [Paenibacillus fonticola]|uniref:hypothetical protein n=1 Tax=Paenibacillus fonticola TaxID=379896 RepID=UPI0003655331|nr:hypothetical protein [Paenibacillus fonticola]
MNNEPGAQPGPYYDNAVPSQPLTRLKHSGLGITSFVMSIVALLGYFVSIFLIIAALGQVLDDPAHIEAAMVESPAAILGVLAMMGAGLLNLIALILGIIGLVIKNRKKVFAIIGTCLSSISVILIIVLYFIGLLQM